MAAFSVVGFVYGGSAYGTRPTVTRCSCSGQYGFLSVADRAAVGVLYDDSDKVAQ